MCPAAMRLWFNVRYRVLTTVATVLANETFTAKSNAERVGFVLAMTDATGEVLYRPQSISEQLGDFVITATAAPRPITIAEFGNMITEPWVFTFAIPGISYTVIELYTPKDFA